MKTIGLKKMETIFRNLKIFNNKKNQKYHLKICFPNNNNNYKYNNNNQIIILMIC